MVVCGYIMVMKEPLIVGGILVEVAVEVGFLEKQGYFCGSVTLVSGRCSCGTIRVVEIVVGC